jgi:predicted amidophosphoribosyltransferase
MQPVRGRSRFARLSWGAGADGLRVRLAHELAALVAPPRCAICAASCEARDVLCGRCDRELAGGHGRELSVAGIDRAWGARPHGGVARDLIHAIKFRSLLPAASRAAELIASEAPPPLLDSPLVPVPPDPIRVAWRGFDPAQLLAEELARRTNAPLSTCLRRRHHRRQVGRTRRERLAAEIDIRAVAPPPSTAILVDDVATTGATLTACALALRSAGSTRVGAVVLAAAQA